MPKNNGGHSDYTATKQEHFKTIVQTHLRIATSIIKKGYASPAYYYFDINAGSGKINGKDGSPIIFLKLSEKYNIDFDIVFIEKNKKTFEKLKRNTWPWSSFTIENGDNRIVLPKYYSDSRKLRYGLLYADPNGIPSFDVIAEISKVPCYSKLDILINCPCNAIKKTRKCSVCYAKETLEEYLIKIDKRFWLIREPYSKWQWTFLIGTNWDSFPIFKKIGFHNLESKTGREIFTKLNYTKDELNGKP